MKSQKKMPLDLSGISIKDALKLNLQINSCVNLSSPDLIIKRIADVFN